MRLRSSPIRLFLIHSFKYPRPLCSQPECLNQSISSNYQFSENSEHFPEKITSEFHSLRNPTFSYSKRNYFSLPTLETTELTETTMISNLLSHKNDPLSALRYFNQVELKLDFAKSLNLFAVLLHILMKSTETHGHARNSLSQYVLGISSPTSISLVDCLIECAKRFDFDIDAKVFNYLLDSYVKADKTIDALECCSRMIECNIIPQVELVNKILTELVKTNFIDEAKELYNKMVLRGVSGQRVKVSTCLKEEKHEQNPCLDNTSSQHQDHSNFSTKNCNSIDFLQIPNGVYVDGSRSYRESTTNECQNNMFQQTGKFSGYIWNNNGHSQINHNGAQAQMSWGGRYNMQNQCSPILEGGGEVSQKLQGYSQRLSEFQGSSNGTFMQQVGQYEQISSDHHTGNVGNYCHSPSVYQQNQDVGQYQQNPKVGQYLSYSNGIHNRMVTSQVETNMQSGEESVEASESSQYNGTLKELDGFIKEGKVKEAVEVLGLLGKQCIPVDLPLLVQLMQVCGEAKVLEEAKAVHEYIVRSVTPLKVSTYNRILKMYSECGSMEDAFNVFNHMGPRNLTSWDTMITGLAKNGLAEDAIDLFSQFKQEGLKPDGQMFIGIFSACSVLGYADEGMLHFESMIKDYGIIPSMKHYVSIVDMLGSIGYLYEAQEFVGKMPMEPCVDVWETLMNLCRIHGNLELGDQYAELVELLDPSRLDEKSKAGLVPVKGSDHVNEKTKRKLASQNVPEVRSTVHEYRAGDTSHAETDKIYALIRGLKSQMKEVGYIPEVRFVLHDIDEESKEEALLAHSERLALSHGLLTSQARAPIRIIKNLRVCVDCHTALKIISKIVGRELIIRDAKRFHHFKDGLCSCRDYW
ncbi:pentatricopeptide repeat-containing protein At4g32450, mitochondrial-like [Mangifera indica]|uniref:pentatricopeptide repeat-containing protein At4g32450, mitochondrial-like n=1 Tax=Mangifera indica TaxID=29780 RepID=UPI001CFA676A|nr:pentatricopeptide repeat-containing protein At4g32450, mitochondrial-like [Mangifera indica]